MYEKCSKQPVQSPISWEIKGQLFSFLFRQLVDCALINPHQVLHETLGNPNIFHGLWPGQAFCRNQET